MGKRDIREIAERLSQTAIRVEPSFTDIKTARGTGVRREYQESLLGPVWLKCLFDIKMQVVSRQFGIYLSPGERSGIEL